MIGWLAAAFPLALYLAWPSTYWNFDGVACAAALELGNPLYLFHAQHLVFGFLGFLFWHALAPLGLTRALPALQLFCSLLSAFGLYFLWRLLKARTDDSWLAASFTAAAGLTAVVWVWSIEAQVYPLGFLGLAGAAAALWSPASSPHPRRDSLRIGAWHALAVLGHVMHVLWIIPALYGIKKRSLPVRPYLAALFTGVGLAYGAVALFVLRPYQGGPEWLSHWLKGSLGLSADRSIAWHGAGWQGPLLWLKATPQVFWGHLWPYPDASHAMIWSVIGTVSIALFSLLAVHALRRRDFDPLLHFAGLWIAVYGLFFFFWEPTTLCYRMTDVIPWTLVLLAGALSLTDRTVRISVAAAWMLSVALLNGATRAWPMKNSDNNQVYVQTVELAKISPAPSNYLTSGGLPWIYLLYFTGRSGWNALTMRDAAIEKFWASSRERRPVYAHSSLLRDPRLSRLLARHRVRQLAPELPWLEIS